MTKSKKREREWVLLNAIQITREKWKMWKKIKTSHYLKHSLSLSLSIVSVTYNLKKKNREIKLKKKNPKCFSLWLIIDFEQRLPLALFIMKFASAHSFFVLFFIFWFHRFVTVLVRHRNKRGCVAGDDGRLATKLQNYHHHAQTKRACLLYKYKFSFSV